MALQVLCSYCARNVDVPDDYLGAGVRCPHCAEVFAVQQTGIATEEPMDPAALAYELVDGGSQWKQRPLPRTVRYARGRGWLLLALGGMSIALSLAGMAGNGYVLGMSVLFGPPAFAIGLTAWLMGQRDMELLRRAIIDPNADRLTRLGWITGMVGTLLAVPVLFCGFCGLYVLLASDMAPK